MEDSDDIEDIGVVEDEENVSMTCFNRVDAENLPFIDLVPADDQDVGSDTLQTGSEEAPYGGANWNTIPRPAIA